MNARMLRAGAIAVLVTDLLAFPAAVAVHEHTDDHGPARVVEQVVQSQCIDGHIVQGVNDQDPAGLLARDTEVTCK